MNRSIFSFPNPVNDVAARTVASGVIALTVLTLATQWLWLTAVLVYGFLARVSSGPRFSPLALFATRIVAPRLGKNARLVPGPPKRFAQAMGAVFTVAAMSCWLGGFSFAANVLLALLLLPASLEAGLGYCIGCEVFGLLMRMNLIPESVCLECADIYGAAAARRRAAV